MEGGPNGEMTSELVEALLNGRARCDRDDDGELLAVELGTVDYDLALKLQRELCERRRCGAIADLVLVLEHPPIYTLGRGATTDAAGVGGLGSVPWRRVGRGGEVTFHGPGQMIGYPIVDLARRPAGIRLDVASYVRGLETAIIAAVAQFGLVGGRVDGRPGVWVSGRKLASIGIGIRRWVTSHGFALNVTTDLSYFDRIVPCGLPGVEMTSLSREGVRVDASAVRAGVASALAAELGYSGVSWIHGDRIRKQD